MIVAVRVVAVALSCVLILILAIVSIRWRFQREQAGFGKWETPQVLLLTLKIIMAERT